MPTTIQETKRLSQQIAGELVSNGAQELPSGSAAIIEEHLDNIVQEWESEAEKLSQQARSEGYDEGFEKGRQEAQDENTALKERIFALEGGFSTSLPAAYLIAEEVARARKKYPEGDFENRMDGFTGEAGEAMQALVKLKHGWGSLEHARLEVIQAAGQCVRLLEEALVEPEPTRHCADINEHEAQP